MQSSHKSAAMLLGIISVMTISHAANAEGPPVQHRFVSGLPALAAQVNANFQELSDRIQDNTDSIATNATNIANNTAAITAGTSAVTSLSATVAGHTTALAALAVPASYDYHNYSSAANVATQTYSITGNGLAASGCTTETRATRRTVVGAVTNIDVTRTRTNTAAATCGNHVLHFVSQADGYYWKGIDSSDNNGTLLSTAVINEPVLLRAADMQIGRSFGGAGSTTTTTLSTGAVVNSTITENSTVQGLEDVTVPYNGGTTYNGCLRIHEHRASGLGFGGVLDQVSWYCSGIGLTKRIDSAGNIWMLTNITTN